jgi:outer membrane protein assembly factor BamB
MFHSFSEDGGQSFSRPRLVDTAAVSGLDLAVAVDGRVFLAASDGEARVIRVLSSSDGGRSFSASVPVAPVRAQWYTSQPSHCRRQSLVHTSIAVDRSSGPRRGMLYLTWSDYAPEADLARCGDACSPNTPCTTQVFVTRSIDGGFSWTEPVALPDQQPGSDRYFQWARVDASDGVLYVAYKDSRLDPQRVSVDVYLSRSTDGALSWEPPLRLSSASSDASAHSFQYGDYQGLAVAEGRVYAAWSDYRTGDGEVFVGRLLFTPSP